MESMALRVAPKAGKPLYQQVYEGIVTELRAGHVAAGERLPAKRRLAAELCVSLNTVDTAYQMLTAEGYVQPRARSGYYAQPFEKLPAPARPAPAPAPPSPAPSWRYDLGTSGVDTTLFPFKAWRRIQRDVLAGDPALLNPGQRQGDEDLRAAIARHIHEYRGAECGAQQVVVGAGMEYLLGLLARLFAGAAFAVETPGYARTHRVLANNGARVLYVPVDAYGMSAQQLERSGAQLACVTPSHQFPTGVTMPVGRRQALLQWAGAAPQRYLIEDDYDSEFRFTTRPLPCLQGMDDAGRVLYLGTFSRSIAPAIRIAYMVLPQALLPHWQAEFGFYSCTVSRPEQQTLCRFLRTGQYARHMARLRNAYRQRKDALVRALNDALGAQRITVTGSHTGLHLVLQLHGAQSETQLVQAAQAAGVHITGLSAYYDAAHRKNCPPASVVLGYGGLASADIEDAAKTLARAWGIAAVSKQ